MKKIDYLRIIQKYFNSESNAFSLYLTHVTLVTRLSLDIAISHGLSNESLSFIEEAAMLHDIGISQVHAPSIGCFGDHEYVEHGYLGRDILETEGLHTHALVCERHTGSGITKEEIVRQGLPLPNRDMLPETVEEKIICYADLFYSKKPGELFLRKDIDVIRAGFEKFSDASMQRFEELHQLFEK